MESIHDVQVNQILYGTRRQALDEGKSNVPKASISTRDKMTAFGEDKDAQVASTGMTSLVGWASGPGRKLTQSGPLTPSQCAQLASLIIAPSSQVSSGNSIKLY
jgi:hypothetical protein